MAIQKYEEMNKLELDVLKEIGSIGDGNAATALSSMLNVAVQMTLPDVQILEFNEALNRLGKPEDLVAAVLVEMSGEINGVMLFILTEEFSSKVLGIMIGKESVDFLKLDDIDSSALTEVGNILISSYLNSLASLAGVEIRLSVPQIAVSMLGGILSTPMANVGLYSEKLLMINAELEIDKNKMRSNMLLLPDIESLNVLMKKLGVSA